MRAFGSAHRKLKLLRVVKAEFVAREGDVELDDLLAASREGGNLPILVFVYPVSVVPDRRGFKGKPLAVPTVVDGELSPAFCPAPGSDPVGRVVNLAGEDREPAREVVHPFFVPEAEHIFRVGEVTRPVPADLAATRTRHLRHLRDLRPGYAAATDADLLGEGP